MLGYPAHFGQIECLKLVASPRFSDKRLGYLGIMLLLDENQEVLMLVTNSLKKCVIDSFGMTAYPQLIVLFAQRHEPFQHVRRRPGTLHFRQYLVGRNVSRSVQRDRKAARQQQYLHPEEGTFHPSFSAMASYPFVVLQAALCAIRVIRRVPELMDHFLEKAKSLLHDRNHGVLLAGVTLVNEMCEVDENVRGEFKKVRPLPLYHGVCAEPSMARNRRSHFWSSISNHS
jgi:AP-1 complex subunit gamma-1